MEGTIIKTFIIAISIGSISLTCPSQDGKYTNGLVEEKISWQGMERNYFVHLPLEGKMRNPLPILFMLHGGGGTAKGTVKSIYGRFNTLANQHGFIVVYPNAVKKNWNDGRKSDLKPGQEKIDDVGFIVEILKSLTEKYNIDQSRIFSTGMSNGGLMTSRLLCDRADLFRGGAILTATLSSHYLSKCDPERPVSVLIMNGTLDPVVPYDGGNIKRSTTEVVSTDDYVEFWKQINGCVEQQPTINFPDLKRFDGTTVSVDTYTNCEGDGALVLYKIRGGGHTWPGGKQYLPKKMIGNVSRDINACDEIWEFFSSIR